MTSRLTGESYADSYKDGVFSRMFPKRNLALDKEGFGAIELGLRYSRFDASDFKTAAAGCVTGTGCLATASATAAYTNEADAWTLGAKWILTPNTRLLLNYVRTSFDTPVLLNGKRSDSEEALMMRAQYDF